MYGAAVEANVDSEWDGTPCWILCAAVEACLVALKSARVKAGGEEPCWLRRPCFLFWRAVGATLVLRAAPLSAQSFTEEALLVFHQCGEETTSGCGRDSQQRRRTTCSVDLFDLQFSGIWLIYSARYLTQIFKSQLFRSLGLAMIFWTSRSDGSCIKGCLRNC
jgi:hypothetical protein